MDKFIENLKFSQGEDENSWFVVGGVVGKGALSWAKRKIKGEYVLKPRKQEIKVEQPARPRFLGRKK